MDLMDMTVAEMQAMLAEGAIALEQKLQDKYTFDLDGYDRFKVVLGLYGTKYKSKAAGRDETENRLRLMLESHGSTLAEFQFSQPGVPYVYHVLGKDVNGYWVKIKSKYDRDIDASFTCMDCGADTHREHYTVQDEVWQAATGHPYGANDGMLCVGCIEKRLDRRLVPTDFVDAPVNDLEVGKKSDRLIERLTSVPAA